MTDVLNWFVYIIQGDDGHYYTGITTNIQRRWQQHLSGNGGARYFRGRKPERLCLLEGQHNRSSASQREYQIKQLSHANKTRLIEQHKTVTIELSHGPTTSM